MIDMELLRMDIVNIFDGNLDKSIKFYILDFYDVCKKHNILIYKPEGNGFVSSGEFILAQSFFQAQFTNCIDLETVLLFTIPPSINNCP